MDGTATDNCLRTHVNIPVKVGLEQGDLIFQSHPLSLYSACLEDILKTKLAELRH